MNPIKTIQKQKSLGLVLSGGGARGLAHIGVLKMLENNGIHIDWISGCSMGGLIGALYAVGYSVHEIENIAKKYTTVREMINLVDRTPRRRGLIVGQRLKNLLSTLIGKDTQFSDTRLPLVINAVDLISSKEIILNTGNLLNAVMATISVPGFFAPVEIDHLQLIDGGTLNNLPIDHIMDFHPDIVLAVDVHPDIKSESPWPFSQSKIRFPLPVPDFLMDLYRTQLIMTTRLTELNLEKVKPSLLIRPALPPEINTFYGYQKAESLIKLGEECVQRNLDQLSHLLFDKD